MITLYENEIIKLIKNNDIIITTSTSPKRLDKIDNIIDNILNKQTVKPTKFYLNVPYVFKRTGEKYNEEILNLGEKDKEIKTKIQINELNIQKLKHINEKTSNTKLKNHYDFIVQYCARDAHVWRTDRFKLTGTGPRDSNAVTDRHPIAPMDSSGICDHFYHCSRCNYRQLSQSVSRADATHVRRRRSSGRKLLGQPE